MKCVCDCVSLCVRLYVCLWVTVYVISVCDCMGHYVCDCVCDYVCVTVSPCCVTLCVTMCVWFCVTMSVAVCVWLCVIMCVWLCVRVCEDPCSSFLMIPCGRMFSSWQSIRKWVFNSCTYKRTDLFSNFSLLRRGSFLSRIQMRPQPWRSPGFQPCKNPAAQHLHTRSQTLGDNKRAVLRQ